MMKNQEQCDLLKLFSNPVLESINSTHFLLKVNLDQGMNNQSSLNHLKHP